MKIRIGFVSNSSSSSFVALMSEEIYQEVFKELDAITAATIELSDSIRKIKFEGRDYIEYDHISGECVWGREQPDVESVKARALELAKFGHTLFENDSDLETFWDEKGYVEEYLCESYYEFEELLKKFKDNVYKNRQSF